jgi:hypothetical protein
MKLHHLLVHLIFLVAPALLVIVVFPVCLIAQEVRPEPGTYLAEGGWGDLTIKRTKDGRITFTIFAMGGNAHMCDLGGEIRNGRATLVDSGDIHNPCIILFRQKGTNVEVSVETDEPCRYYCGMRASFEGTYLWPAAACLPKAINKSRADFQRLYGKKAYAEAVDVLEPIVKGCSKTMHWLDKGWISNDLALTYHKLGRDDLCLQNLKGLEEDAGKTDEQIREQYPPADADNYLPIVKAARTNLLLCRRGKKTKPAGLGHI